MRLPCAISIILSLISHWEYIGGFDIVDDVYMYHDPLTEATYNTYEVPKNHFNLENTNLSDDDEFNLKEDEIEQVKEGEQGGDNEEIEHEVYEPVTEHEVYEPVTEHEVYEPVTEHEVYEPVTEHEENDLSIIDEKADLIKEYEEAELIKKNEEDEPVTEHEVYEPVTEHEVYEPVTEEHEEDKPVTEHEVYEPVTEHEIYEPVTEHEENEPVTEHEEDEPVKEIKENEPVKENNEDDLSMIDEKSDLIKEYEEAELIKKNEEENEKEETDGNAISDHTSGNRVLPKQNNLRGCSGNIPDCIKTTLFKIDKNENVNENISKTPPKESNYASVLSQINVTLLSFTNRVTKHGYANITEAMDKEKADKPIENENVTSLTKTIEKTDQENRTDKNYNAEDQYFHISKLMKLFSCLFKTHGDSNSAIKGNEEEISTKKSDTDFIF